ncbi:MAG: AI-2E family transporter [Phycisphaerales bacterium]|nr:AI-2E family transporter [Phycisphaerales bacterium]
MESSTKSQASVGVNGWRLIMALAGLVVIVAGLQLASSLLVPIAAAVFFAVLCIPPVNWLQKRKVPQWLAVIIVFVVVLVAFVFVGLIVNQSISSFLTRLPDYQTALQERLKPIDPFIEKIGLGDYVNPLLSKADDTVDPTTSSVIATDQMAQADEAETGGIGDPSNLLPFITRALRALSSIMSNTVFVMLMVVFILAEAAGLPRKFCVAVTNPEADLEAFSGIVGDLQTYIKVKTILSLATGILAGGLCWLVGTDYPVLWGLLAFLLNFIPTFGSILAAIPPVLLTWVMLDWQWAAVILAGYLVINNVLGNIIEPRMMGTRLGMSTLVVFLSMVFWGWVWGPVGMILSVPLTMILKIMLQHTPDLAWIAVLLASDAEVRDREKEMRSENPTQSC